LREIEKGLVTAAILDEPADNDVGDIDEQLQNALNQTLQEVEMELGDFVSDDEDSAEEDF